jgi:hypothetical protein
MSPAHRDKLDPPRRMPHDTRERTGKPAGEALGGLLRPVSHSQDAPRPSSASSRLLAITRLAKPNRLNSCAWFLASPL